MLKRPSSKNEYLATFDEEQYFCLDTTNVSSEIINKNYDLKFIVGLMNSKLINWWFNDEFKNPTISGYELHQIPVKSSKVIEKEITTLVSIILENTKLNTDNSEQLKKIDHLVYNLYNLTEKEIQIIESSIK